MIASFFGKNRHMPDVETIVFLGCQNIPQRWWASRWPWPPWTPPARVFTKTYL